MKCSTTTSHSHDMLSNPLLAFALFCLPAIAIVATGHYRIGDGWRTAVWTAALSIMGTACLANAVRCGRVHCYITGPFLLVGLTILVGAIALSCLPEMFFGKYRRGRGRSADHR